ncbi:MAG: family 10 glycosylhydrolase, partial [Leptolyngbyaceae cyanobacterium MO_188.B28]|nr:family 10 glycosylhydrolase [Leptolyngbyaceae cyanobacterium MO_188.B28]
FSVILVLLGLGYWGFRNLDKVNISQHLPEPVAKYWPKQTSATTPDTQSTPLPDLTPDLAPDSTPAPSQPTLITDSSAPQVTAPETPKNTPPIPQPPVSPEPSTPPQTPWEQKEIRGIYLSRYQTTNNADEQTIRNRVRYYREQGVNTLIHGVWGNGCTMYDSDVMRETLGYKSCPNHFRSEWLDWLIDEAHKQGMEVHAYFEKGIKLDENSPIFDLAITKRWIVPGVDKTYPDIDHYLLDVEIPEVEQFFKQILVEFVQRYPDIDAVQWDDYLGYHDDLPGKVDRTTQLTHFVRELKADMKAANANVSFDLCHHNPYWGKEYFAADWPNWQVDRAFIQAYNDDNFSEELAYAEQYNGIAITDEQLHHLDELVNNDKIESILLFPSAGNPEETAALFKQLASEDL